MSWSCWRGRSQNRSGPNCDRVTPGIDPRPARMIRADHAATAGVGPPLRQDARRGPTLFSFLISAHFQPTT
jgi:hypothetical protein